MLKTLKWVYDLGVEQERVRIARALEAELNRQQATSTTGYNMLSDPEVKISKERKRKLEFEVAVAVNTAEIIGAIMKPAMDFVPTSSIMFPEEEK